MKDYLIQAKINKVEKGNRTFYNISVDVEGMKVELAPKFLNHKQMMLFKHKLSRYVGDEKNANK